MVHAQRGSSAQSPTLLVIGRPEHWPEIITQLANENAIQVQCAAGIHEAAARLAMGRERILAVLVEPEGLSRREWGMVSLLKHHIVQPIWSLPARARREQILVPGVLPWETAARILGQLPQVNTPKQPEGNKGILEVGGSHNAGEAALVSTPADRADNGPGGRTENGAEMPVVSAVAEGYDEDGGEPLLSENEIRALLAPE